MSRTRDNILLPAHYGSRFEYQYPRVINGNTDSKYPTRENRKRHAQTVLEKLNGVKSEIREISAQTENIEGFYIEFKGEPKDLDNNKSFELKAESLDTANSFEVVSYKKHDDGTEQVVVFVPEGKLQSLENKIASASRDENPRNIKLVSSISDMKLAILESLWTSPEDQFPTNDTTNFLWEVWTFQGEGYDRKLELFCDTYNAELLPSKTDLLDRTVRLIRTSAKNLANILHHQKIVTELRRPADTPAPITDGNIEDQIEWSEELLSRIRREDSDVEIWMLDSGVNREHQLLAQHINVNKTDSVNPEWGTEDSRQRWGYHGTRMSGIALYGNLLNSLLENEIVNINHSIGSVKILPPFGANDPQLYPYITEDAVARANILSPHSKKVFCLAVTDSETCIAGESTSWSAKIDELCFDDEDKKLFIIAAGNSFNRPNNNYPYNYPEENKLSPIQDPAQSWNSLTVGGYTELQQIDEDELQHGYYPLSRAGELSPSSTTSLTWTSLNHVPLKPDIVFEAGNIAMENGRREFDEPASLQILTTSGAINTEPFSTISHTSCASALASNFSAKLFSRYEDYWPETIRGLIVHSADWTDLMKQQFEPFDRKYKVQSLLRTYGYGTPSFQKAVSCADNEVTIIAQRSLRPYKRPNTNITYSDCHLYDIPWPSEVLEQLGQETIKMKVTLSYFIEPNPSRRGHIKKYDYASHGLKFTMISPTESEESFKQRVSKVFQNDDSVNREREDTHNWFLGPDLRTRGSIHSDIWEGQAADLARKSKLAVFPIGGWWKEYKSHNRWENEVRYTLIISIESNSEEADIYNEVLNSIQIPIEINI